MFYYRVVVVECIATFCTLGLHSMQLVPLLLTLHPPLGYPDTATVITGISIKSHYAILTSPVTYNHEEMIGKKHTSHKITFLRQVSCLFYKNGLQFIINRMFLIFRILLCHLLGEISTLWGLRPTTPYTSRELKRFELPNYWLGLLRFHTGEIILLHCLRNDFNYILVKEGTVV